MRTMILAVALVALVPACESIFPKCDDPKRPCPDVEPNYPATAEGACINLERLGCEEAKMTREGISCSHAFRRMSELVDPKLECVAHARDVAAVRRCGSVRCL